MEQKKYFHCIGLPAQNNAKFEISTVVNDGDKTTNVFDKAIRHPDGRFSQQKIKEILWGVFFTQEVNFIPKRKGSELKNRYFFIVNPLIYIVIGLLGLIVFLKFDEKCSQYIYC